jgi:acetyltransferase EpsM
MQFTEFEIVNAGTAKAKLVPKKISKISQTDLENAGKNIGRILSVVSYSFAKIGRNVILNTACIIEHDCTIGDSSHIAPGAVLAGNVKVGERTFIGANAVKKQGVKIGNDVIVGAGSVVIHDIPNNQKVVGNPCRLI